MRGKKKTHEGDALKPVYKHVTYEPGICNIGRTEIRKRYSFGAIGFILTVALFYYFMLSGMLTQWFVLLVIPLFAGFEGLYQGRMHFCAGFAMGGKYDLSGTRKDKGKVTNKTSHRLDITQAMKIHIYSLYSSELATVVLILLSAVLY